MERGGGGPCHALCAHPTDREWLDRALTGLCPCSPWTFVMFAAVADAAAMALMKASELSAGGKGSTCSGRFKGTKHACRGTDFDPCGSSSSSSSSCARQQSRQSRLKSRVSTQPTPTSGVVARCAKLLYRKGDWVLRDAAFSSCRGPEHRVSSTLVWCLSRYNSVLHVGPLLQLLLPM